ncbi:hypothetical protein K8T06_13970 [bacterium]|nr:hypothetical protein [bacterium]
MKFLQKGLILLAKVFLVIIGMKYFLFVADKVLMYADLNPMYYRIESLEQLNNEGWVVPLEFQILRNSVFILIAYIGVFRFNCYKQWSLVVCILGTVFWLSGFCWIENAFCMLNSFQIRAYFVWKIIDFIAIAIVLLRQFYLKFQIEKDFVPNN